MNTETVPTTALEAYEQVIEVALRLRREALRESDRLEESYEDAQDSEDRARIYAQQRLLTGVRYGLNELLDAIHELSRLPVKD